EPDDARLRQRRVEHPPLAEAGLKAVTGAEHAAEMTDVLPEQQHIFVAFQCLAERLIDRLNHVQLGNSRALLGPLLKIAAPRGACVDHDHLVTLPTGSHSATRCSPAEFLRRSQAAVWSAVI